MKFFNPLIFSMTCVSAVSAAPAPSSQGIDTTHSLRNEQVALDVARRAYVDAAVDASGLDKRQTNQNETVAEAAASLAENIMFFNPMGIAASAVRLAGTIVGASGGKNFLGKRADELAQRDAQKDAIQTASESFEKSIASGDANAIQASIMQFVDSMGNVSGQQQQKRAEGGSNNREAISDASWNLARSIVSMNPMAIARTAVQLAGSIVGRDL